MQLCLPIKKPILIFLMSLSLISSSLLGMEKKKEEEITKYREDLGLTILKLTGGISENVERLINIFSKLFETASKEEEINYLFVPKFSHIDTEKFFKILSDEFVKFIEQSNKKIKLILMGYEPKVSQLFNELTVKFHLDTNNKYQDYFFCAKKSDNIHDIIRSLYFDKAQLNKAEVAIFIPGKGVLWDNVNETLEGLNNNKQSQTTNVDLRSYSLTTYCYSHQTDPYVGTGSNTLTIAEYLGKGAEMHKWPKVEIKSNGLFITDLRKIDPKFAEFFKKYPSFGGSTTIMFSKLYSFLDEIGFLKNKNLNTKNEVEDFLAQLIINTKGLESNKLRYYALASIIDGLDGVDVVNLKDKIYNFLNNGDQLLSIAFSDSISYKLMLNPMLARSGYTYELRVIEAWLRNLEVDPITGEPLMVHDLIENTCLKSVVLFFRESNLDINIINDFLSGDKPNYNFLIFLNANVVEMDRLKSYLLLTPEQIKAVNERYKSMPKDIKDILTTNER